ncbi:MAG TPA: hypothetical protein DCY40_03850 [Actinobacteria bacterium]|nr:hypothetical protein [Actinomycetota bacterium]
MTEQEQRRVVQEPVGDGAAPRENKISSAIVRAAETALERGVEVDYTKVFESPVALAHYENVARIFAASQFVPTHYRGKVADCLIAINLAVRMAEDPLAVMQQTFVVGGTIGFETAFMIARFNRYRKQVGFSTRIRWDVVTLEPPTLKGKGKDFENLQVTAYVLDDDGQRVDGTAVSMKMAIAEDWIKNPKYTSMPEHMLKFRAAAFLLRQVAPEILMGIPLVEELVDVQAAGGRVVVVGEGKTASLLAKLADQAEAEAAASPPSSGDAEKSDLADADGGGGEEGGEAETGDQDGAAEAEGGKQEAAPAEPAEAAAAEPEERRSMTDEEVAQVREEARKLGVEIDEVEGYFVEKLPDIEVDGATGPAVFQAVMHHVRKLARERAAATSKRR